MKKLTYESAYEELQEIVNKMQEGIIDIDHLSENVERASELIAFCKEKLRTTEKDLKKLIE